MCMGNSSNQDLLPDICCAIITTLAACVALRTLGTVQSSTNRVTALSVLVHSLSLISSASCFNCTWI